MGRRSNSHGTARLRGSSQRGDALAVQGAHLRRLAFLAAAVALLGNGLAWLGSSSGFIAGCLLCGAAFGVLLNVTNRLVAGTSAPQRGYATVQLVEVLFCIAFYLVVPPIIERFGTLSVFAVLGALCVGVFVLLADVPVGAAGRSEVAKRHGTPANTGAAVLSLCAATLLFAGYSCVNSSLVSIGAAAGLSVLWVGRVMASGLFAGLGGAIFARALGERAGVLLPLLVCAAIIEVASRVEHVEKSVMDRVHTREVGAQVIGQTSGNVCRRLGISKIAGAQRCVRRKCLFRVARDDVYGAACGVAAI
jgi:divalent metal cation (Fe/Co/Zn/Cd) transporter